MLRVTAGSVFMLASLASASAAQAQETTAVVTSKVDLNGDGRLDELRLDQSGKVSAHITGQGAASAATTLQAEGKVVGGSFVVSPEVDAQQRVIVIVKGVLRSDRHKDREEGLVLAYKGNVFVQLWRGRIGLAGGDGATTISLELSPYGIIKYKNRHGVLRCDGATAHLDAERLDLKRGVFRPARQAVRVPATATKLIASSQPPTELPVGTRGLLFRPVGASSSSRAASSAELVAPLELSDGDDSSAWIENVTGTGRGEFVTFRAAIGEVGVRALRLRLGHGAAYNDYDRPKRLGLTLGESEHYWIELPSDPKEVQWVQLPRAVKSDCVTLIIDEVYSGRKYRGHTAVSEVDIFSEEELRPGGTAKLVAQHIASGRLSADVNRLLVALGQEAAPALAEAIAESNDPRARLRLRIALARIPAMPEELVVALLGSSLRVQDELVLTDALHALGDAGLAAIEAALAGKDQPLASYARLINVLAAQPGDAASQTLLAVLGKGDAHRRVLVARALAKREGAVALLLAELAANHTDAERAGLYRSLGLAGKRFPRPSADRQAITEALRSEFARTALPYESQYRLIQATELLQDPELGEPLLALSLASAKVSSAEDLALLRAATVALASLAAVTGETSLGTSIRESVQASLSHSDPGVRLAALSSLRDASWATGSIAERLRVDLWPEVRRSAAAALATRCYDATNSAEALVAAARNDIDASVAQTALASLLECPHSGLLTLLTELVRDGKRPLDLRLQAARALGSAAKSPADTERVHDEFTKARRGALSEAASGELASAMTIALAELADERSVELLESAATDPAFPQLQAASLHALAQICAPRSLGIIHKLRDSHEHNVASAARRASQQCH